MLRVYPLILLFVVCSLALAGAPAQGAEPTSPRPRISMAMDHMEPLGAPDSPWDFVRANLDVFQFQINDLAYLAPAKSINRLAPLLKGGKMEVAIECGHFDFECSSTALAAPNPKRITDHLRRAYDDQVGEETAAMEIRKIALLTAAGVEPNIIVMDDPLRRLLIPGEDLGRPDPARGFPLDRAVGEILDYMKTWQARFPRIRFVAITNFPNWAWKSWPAYRPDRVGWGDYAPRLQALARAARDAGLPLVAIRLDNTLECAQGTALLPENSWDPRQVNWLERMRDLQRTVRAEGLQFELILNSQFGGQASARAFYRQTLRYLDLCRRNGLSPDLYIVQSWYPFPQKAGPENEPYTLTNLTATVIRDFQGEPGAALARELAAPRPRTANPVADLAAPATPQGNACPDGLGLGQWSCWLATGTTSPLTLGPGRASLASMAWNGKSGDYRGYTAAGQDYPSVLVDHVEHLQLVPHVGADPVLRWTALKSGRLHFAGAWWLGPPGNISLAIFAEGKSVFRRDGYTDTSNPGLPFDFDLAVQPGTSVEWWVDANGDPAYDTMHLTLDITPLP